MSNWRVRQLVVVALLVATVASSCSDKKTVITGQAGGELAGNGFPFPSGAGPDEVRFGFVKTVTDEKGDLHFVTGAPPGRQDPFADILKVDYGALTLDEESRAALEEYLKCPDTPAAADQPLVVCGAEKTLADGDYLMFAMQLGAPPPRDIAEDLTGFYSLYVDAGGEPATKPAPPDRPNQPDVNTSFSYQVVFSTKPGPGAPYAPHLQVIDARKLAAREDPIVDTVARAVVDGASVMFLVPVAEAGEFKGFRGATSWRLGSDAKDATKGVADIVPGAAAPFPLIPPLDSGDFSVGP